MINQQKNNIDWGRHAAGTRVNFSEINKSRSRQQESMMKNQQKFVAGSTANLGVYFIKTDNNGNLRLLRKQITIKVGSKSGGAQ